MSDQLGPRDGEKEKQKIGVSVSGTYVYGYHVSHEIHSKMVSEQVTTSEPNGLQIRINYLSMPLPKDLMA